MTREDIAQGCLDQAGWAAKLGSPMYEALLRRMSRAGAGRPVERRLIAQGGLHGRDVRIL